jgi:hypothetical protein
MLQQPQLQPKSLLRVQHNVHIQLVCSARVQQYNQCVALTEATVHRIVYSNCSTALTLTLYCRHSIIQHVLHTYNIKKAYLL